jgi:formate dehydrogenase major subunit
MTGNGPAFRAWKGEKISGKIIFTLKSQKGALFMDVSRRGFLKISSAILAASGIGVSLKPVSAHAQPLKIKYAKETTTICPYCSVGCSIIVSAREGKVINTEGDPDSPINKGSLCSKGGSIYQMSVNENRLGKPLYRAPNATEWKEVDWEWALEKIAANIKKSRDASFKFKNDKGAMDLEECYTYQKFLRGLGLVYIEHQARI